MVNFLIARSFFKVIGLCGTCPHNVPLGAVRTNNSAAASFERIYYGIINMRWFGNFEAQRHVMHTEVVLCCHLNLLKRTYIWRLISLHNFQIRVSLRHSWTVIIFTLHADIFFWFFTCSHVVVTIRRIREKYSGQRLWLSKRYWL